MRSLWRSLVRLVVLIGAVSPVLGEGLVQLELEGSVTLAEGQYVEILVVRPSGAAGGERELSLELHLHQGTSGSDLAALLGQHLERTGFDVIAPEPAEGSAQLFIDAVRRVRVRVGGGLRSRITLCDTVPETVRIDVPRNNEDGGSVRMSGTVLQEHTRERRGVSFSASIDAETANATTVAQALMQAGADAGWNCERTSQEYWMPGTLRDGSVFLGFSVYLQTTGAWEVDIVVADAS